MQARSITDLYPSRLPSVSIDLDRNTLRHQKAFPITTGRPIHRAGLKRYDIERGESYSRPRVKLEFAPTANRPQLTAVPSHINI